MEYRLNKKLVEQLGNGDIILKYSGACHYDMLKQILKEAFPNDNSIPNGTSSHYVKSNVTKDSWTGTDIKRLDTTKMIPRIEDEDFIQIELQQSDTDKNYSPDPKDHNKTFDNWDDLFDFQAKKDGANYVMLKEWLKKFCEPPKLKN